MGQGTKTKVGIGTALTATGPAVVLSILGKEFDFEPEVAKAMGAAIIAEAARAESRRPEYEAKKEQLIAQDKKMQEEFARTDALLERVRNGDTSAIEEMLYGPKSDETKH